MNFEEINKSKKILRDLVHGYINLTDIDLLIIDTLHFQRLKDIRQLTAQHVYPSARHTRFEHSLGVMELTRQAIKHINDNGFLSGIPKEFDEIYKKNGEKIVDAKLEFNTSLAALLHDIGHCPFSHLGEELFEIDGLSGDDAAINLQERIIILINEKRIEGTDINELIKTLNKNKCGSIHELLSCIIILEEYYNVINQDLSHSNLESDDGKNLKDISDFEFIIRCILGIQYKVANKPELIKNIMIGLINSNTLDMDKLDYIMRDVFYTGITVPKIDTKRLFKNMHISKHYELVYTSNAVPVLQTIIEGRDNLYLWVCNHHAVVYTDFLYYYIFRRLRHNADRHEKIKNEMINNGENCNECQYFKTSTIKHGSLFSIEAIKNRLVSDSSIQHYLVSLYQELNDKNEIKESINIENKRVFTLLEDLFSRKLLKPWWKTVFEYKHFMESRIPDDKIRNEISKRICAKTKIGESIEASEFRSQIAKGVIALSKKLKEANCLEKSLSDGDFFVVERSNRFFSLKYIENISIYLKKNAIIKHDFNKDEEVKQENEYFAKSLTKLFPSKDYEDFFNSDNFYVYIRPYEMIMSEKKSKTKKEKTKEREFYEKIEKIFIAISSELAIMSKEKFDEYCGEVDSNKSEEKLPEMLEEIQKELTVKFQKQEKNNI